MTARTPTLTNPSRRPTDGAVPRPIDTTKCSPRWRRALAETYYYASYPQRRWYHRRLAAADRAPIAVLAFHRIADDAANRWTTRTDVFVEVIRWLKPRYDLISLDELQRRLREGSNSRPSVCITFDDGYAVNCRVALPLLVAERVPCTYFVTSDAVLRQQPFEHDVVMGNTHFQPNTIEQLREFSRAGMDIGAHTRTHPDVGQITDREQLREELVGAKLDLEAALDRPVRYFAFPFGSPANLSDEAFAMAHAAGYDGACSAYGGWNAPGDPPFHIRRRCVDGPANRAKNWALIDPIRARTLPEFVWTGPPAGASHDRADAAPVSSQCHCDVGGGP